MLIPRTCISFTRTEDLELLPEAMLDKLINDRTGINTVIQKIDLILLKVSYINQILLTL